MSKLSRYHPRPRIQRAFLSWFRENRSRFIVPIQITKVSHKGIGLKFPDHPDCLLVWLSRFGLNVHVQWQGIWWDMLISLDSCPHPGPGGYRCPLTIDSVEIWPTREDLWRAQLFEMFLSWANDKFARSDSLALYGEPNSLSWASLRNSKIDSFKTDSFIVSVLLPCVNARASGSEVT